MRVYKDKSGKYKLGPNSNELFDTKEQCQRYGLDVLAERLATIRKKYDQGILGYGK